MTASLEEIGRGSMISGQMEEEEKKGAVFGKFAGDYKKTCLWQKRKRSFGFHPDTMCGTPAGVHAGALQVCG